MVRECGLSPGTSYWCTMLLEWRPERERRRPGRDNLTKPGSACTKGDQQVTQIRMLTAFGSTLYIGNKTLNSKTDALSDFFVLAEQVAEKAFT